MATNGAQHPFFKLTIIGTVLICVYEALTKGWVTLLLLPISLVILPIYALIQYKSLKHNHGPYAIPIRITSVLLTVSILTFYIGIVGAGDTKEVLLFGFYRSTVGSSITVFSSTLSYLAFFATPVTFIALGAFLIANYSRIKSKKTMVN